MTTTAITATAVRIFRGKSPKVVVTIEGQEPFELGGARAGRAQAVLVGSWAEDKLAGHMALFRADLQAAQTEAHRLVNKTTMRTRRGSVLPLNTMAWCIAVPVTEAS